MINFSRLQKIFLNAYDEYFTFAKGKKIYQFTSAITAGVTETTATAGSFAITTNAPGKNQLFISDGTYWQDYLGKESSSLVLATVGTSAGNTDAYAMAPFTGKLIGVMFSTVDALAAHDTNYVTFSLVNISNSNAAMLLATDANTSKITGGTAIAANTKRDLALHGTPANLAVTAGDRLRMRIAGSGTLANTLTFPVVIFIYQRTI